MLVTLDKYGNVTLPGPIREKLGLNGESYLEVFVEEDGTIILHPVSVHRTIQLTDKGLEKLEEARKSGTGELPEWLKRDIDDAATDSDREIY